MTGLLMAVLCTRSIGCNNEWHAPGRTNPSFPSPITIKTRIMFSVNMKNLQSIRVFQSEAKLSYCGDFSLFYSCSARFYTNGWFIYFSPEPVSRWLFCPGMMMETNAGCWSIKLLCALGNPVTGIWYDYIWSRHSCSPPPHVTRIIINWLSPNTRVSCHEITGRMVQS